MSVDTRLTAIDGQWQLQGIYVCRNDARCERWVEVAMIDAVGQPRSVFIYGDAVHEAPPGGRVTAWRSQ